MRNEPLPPTQHHLLKAINLLSHTQDTIVISIDIVSKYTNNKDTYCTKALQKTERNFHIPSAYNT